MAAALWWRSWPSCDRRPTRREPTHGASGAGDRRGTRPQRSRLGHLRQIGKFTGPSHSVRAAPRTERPQPPVFFSLRCDNEGRGCESCRDRLRKTAVASTTHTAAEFPSVFRRPGGETSECRGGLVETTGAALCAPPQVFDAGVGRGLRDPVPVLERWATLAKT